MCAYNNYKYSFKSQFVSILCHTSGETYAQVGEDSSSVVQGIHVGHGLIRVEIKFSVEFTTVWSLQVVRR